MNFCKVIVSIPTQFVMSGCMDLLITINMLNRDELIHHQWKQYFVAQE